jgi:hypothetical protein
MSNILASLHLPTARGISQDRFVNLFSYATYGGLIFALPQQVTDSQCAPLGPPYELLFVH